MSFVLVALTRLTHVFVHILHPVRLPSGYAESSESGGESSLTCREKRKKREKRGRTQHSSSDGERCGSKE